MRGWALVWPGQRRPLKERRKYEFCTGAVRRSSPDRPANDADALTGEALCLRPRTIPSAGATPGPTTTPKCSRPDRPGASRSRPMTSRAYLRAQPISYRFRAARTRGSKPPTPRSPSARTTRISAGGARSSRKFVLGRFEQAKTDFRPAIRLSPRDPAIAQWHVNLGLAELGLGRFDAASEEFRSSINFGNRTFIPYGCLAAASALADRAMRRRSALAVARRLNPQLTVRQMTSVAANIPNLLEGLRKAGLTEP